MYGEAAPLAYHSRRCWTMVRRRWHGRAVVPMAACDERAQAHAPLHHCPTTVVRLQQAVAQVPAAKHGELVLAA